MSSTATTEVQHIRTHRETLAVPSSPARDAALLLMRIWLGAMMIVHGWPKLFGGIGGFTEGVAKMGFPAPELFAWAAALSEVGGGLLLALGLLTRPASAFVAVTMFVAAFIRHAPDPFGRKELPITYLVIALALMLIGPGRLALDAMMAGRRRRA